MKIDHIAAFVKNPEISKAFYEKYFGARANAGYHNPKTGLQTYFLSFSDGSRFEIMRRPDILKSEEKFALIGLAHISFCVDGKENVDALARRLEADGYRIISLPRTTGDGYYETCVQDPDGIAVEILA